MYYNYLKHLLRHKWFVFLYACEYGIPWLGIIHDFSKFLPWEFFPYAKYFYPGDSPNNRDHGLDFDVAWNHHQKHNKHHWQYYLLTNDNDVPQTRPLSIPERYILELISDWRGAGRAYGNPNTLDWYNENKHKQTIHPDTRKRIEELLNDL